MSHQTYEVLTAENADLKAALKKEKQAHFDMCTSYSYQAEELRATYEKLKDKNAKYEELMIKYDSFIERHVAVLIRHNDLVEIHGATI